MIKRRFYKHEHGDRDRPSDSSSSSDSELEAVATEETEEEEDDVVAEVRENNKSCSSSSGYKSEDSSANEVDLDSSGLPTNEDDMEAGNDEHDVCENHAKRNAEIVDTQCNTEIEKDAIPSDVPGCVLKCKSVFRCRLCPRIVCLTEETLRAHLKSKRHSRSEKLLSEGRLKFMLNSDGEIEGETYQDTLVSPSTSAQNSANSKKKNKGRQRQRMRKRLKKEPQGTGNELTSEKTRPSTKNPAKKRRKS